MSTIRQARRLAFLLLMFCLVPAALQAAGKKYALVVGVETYDKRFFHNLKFAEEDAAEIGKALQLLGFDVIIMTRQAENPHQRPNTAKKILHQLNGWVKKRQKEDTVIVMFSGHGVCFTNPKKLADGTEAREFFCPDEADLTKPESLLPLSQIYAVLKASPAERKLLIVDACRNKPLPKFDKGSPLFEELDAAGVTPRTVPKGILAIYSCTEGEKSWEDPDLKHGVFTYYILKYLNGKANLHDYSRNQLTIKGLERYASRETQDYLFRKMSIDQIPVLKGTTSDWPFGEKIQAILTNSIGMEFRKS